MNPVLIGVLMLLVGLPPLAIVIVTLWPGLVERTRQHVEGRPRRSLAVGAINALFFGLIVMGLSNGDDGTRLLGLLLASALLCLVAVGLTAIADLIGRRIWPTARWRPAGIGGALVLLELAALVPLVGWLGVPLLTGLIGGGATILALIGYQPAVAPSHPPAPPRVVEAGGLIDQP